MITTIQLWGNSLAIRIPKAFAEQAELEEASEVDIALEGRTIVVRAARKEWKLEELLKGITASNRPRAVDWGKPAGKEIW
ncbi:MAG: AbrB/MazE/SpoVT family DNA-binding domain-containing protein [Gemmatimonadota bacterium]|nr:AbrB/MazE/SpoVT family DNA-binding domain-containing protein [Gemmatimonadota bacterium]